MLWHIFLFVSIFSYSISAVLQKYLLKGVKDPIGFAIFFQVCTALFIGFFALLTGFSIPDMHPIWLNFLGSVFIYSVANICLFQSLFRIDASEFTILFVTRGVWTILAATLFLHETFSFRQSIGTALVLLSVLIVSYKKHKLHFNVGSAYGLFAGLLFGVGFVNDAYIVRFFHSPITYSFLDFLFPGLVLATLFKHSVAKTAAIMLTSKKLWTLFVLCLFYAVFGVTVLLSYKYGGQASVIGAVSQLATIVTVILAIIFLNERKNMPQKIVGAIIAVIGVILVG